MTQNKHFFFEDESVSEQMRGRIMLEKNKISADEKDKKTMN